MTKVMVELDEHINKKAGIFKTVNGLPSKSKAIENMLGNYKIDIKRIW